MKAFLPTLALAGLLATAASAQSFYGIADGQLLSVNGATGAGTVIGALAPGLAPSGLAAFNGGLYTFDAGSDRIVRINPATGATVATTGIGLSGLSGGGGLAFSSAGIGYLDVPLTMGASLVNYLYSFNLTAGTSTLLGSTTDSLSGLAFSPGGTLYGLGKADGNLYALSTTSAASTLLGTLGIPDVIPGVVSGYSSDGAIAFTPGGALYEVANEDLYAVSSTTGKALSLDGNGLPLPVNPALVASSGSGLGSSFGSVVGLAPAAAVPEASPALLLGACLLPGLLVLRRRKA